MLSCLGIARSSLAAGYPIASPLMGVRRPGLTLPERPYAIEVTE
jgi:hypothetical protein